MKEDPPGGLDRQVSATRTMADSIRRAQIKQLFAQVQTGLIAAHIVAVALTVGLWNVVPHAWLIAWLIAYIVAQIPRHLLFRAYRKDRPSDDDLVRYQDRFTIWNLISAVLWGLAALLFFPTQSVPHQFFLAVCVTGISLGSAAVCWPVISVSVRTILLVLTPLAARFLYEGDRVHMAVGALILLFSAALLLVARYMHRTNLAALKLRFENEALVEELSAHVHMRERVQEELRRSWDELEVRVSDRTARLDTANQQLVQEIAERTRAEEALRESKQMARTILSTSPIGICLARSRRIVWVNRSWGEMFGFEKEEEYLGKSTKILYASEEEYNRVGRVLAEAEADLRAGKTVEIDVKGKRKDGSTFYGVIRGAYLDCSDPGRGFIVATSDISSRKRTEEALRESERTYRELVENLSDLVFKMDIRGILTYISPQVEAMFGDQPSEVIGRHYADFVHDEDSPSLAKSLQSVLENRLYPSVFRVRTKAGDYRWARSSSRPILEGGVPVGITGIVRDITEEKRSEEALRESEAKYRTLFEESVDGILITDEETDTVVDANQSLLHLFGYSRDEFVGTSPLKVYCDPFDRDRFRHEIETRGSVKDYPVRLCKKDGAEMNCQVTASPQRNKEGAIVGYRGLVRDVTHEKSLEKQLLQAQKMEAIGTLQDELPMISTTGSP